MSSDPPKPAGTVPGAGHVGNVPVRNLWLLLLYASDLGRFHDRLDVEPEDCPDLPTLVARLLASEVERRLHRSLTRGYRRREAVLGRVRGAIDVPVTWSRGLMRQGRIACRFHDHTVDTPRNRLVRAALEGVALRIEDDGLRHRCRSLARDMASQGIGSRRPSSTELASEPVGRNDASDVPMVRLAATVFDLRMPSESSGKLTVAQPDRDVVLVRRLFERAVGNFYRLELPEHDGWRIDQGKVRRWPVSRATAGANDVLPQMQTDILVHHLPTARRMVIDTKFTDIFTRHHDRDRLKSGYLYQMYAYLRSQVHKGDPPAETAEGLLLHPSLEVDVDEAVEIQGHLIRFATVDLYASTPAVLDRLRHLVLSSRVMESKAS